jgi:hypothetical protein
VLAAYAVPSQWTGFAGHTLWDWLHLLLLPLLVPAIAGPRAQAPQTPMSRSFCVHWSNCSAHACEVITACF